MGYIDRLSKLDLRDCSCGNQILYCPLCTWQASGVGMKPLCPDCGASLRGVRVDMDLIDLVKGNSDE